MMRGCKCAMVALAVATASISASAGAEPQQTVVISHVTVIDGRSATPRRDQTVVIKGNRIVAVGPTTTLASPSGFRTIDGRGKFLIPGLWDMHVHTAIIGGRALLGLYVANGVTGVRDMAGDLDTLRRWRNEIAKGALDGPRIVASGPYLEGGDVPIPHLLTRTPAEGRAGVDSLKRLGVDFIKVHGQLTPDTYFSIARRARELGMPFAGHVSRAVGALAASDSGQRSIEHLLGIPVPCTQAESTALAPRYSVQGAIGRCSSQSLAPLYSHFVRNSTWVTPTFVASYQLALWPRAVVPGDSLAHYLPDSVKRFIAQILPMPDSIPPNADSVGRAIFQKRLRQVSEMHRAGVRVLAGTDAPLRNSPPGFGLHEELSLLVRGGMSPLSALRAATLEPARFLKMEKSSGAVAVDMYADLLLLDANPLVDIRNTRRISTVIANGRVYDAAATRRLLAAPTASKP